MKSLSQCRILVVDDMEENLWIAEDLLREVCLVTTLQEGARAVEKAVDCRPDLILLDVIMPLADGFSICRALKQDPRTSHVPVIFLTSLEDSDSRLEGFEAGGVDYVTKPFNSGELRARVVTHLRLALMEQDLRDNVRHLARSLESTEENYLFIARSSTDVLLKLDAGGKIAFVNPVWAEISGRQLGEILGRPFADIVTDADAPGVASALEEAVETGAEETRMQFRMAGRHGPLWVRASLRLIRDQESGAWQGATGILTDITDLVEQSEGLEITKEGIQEAHTESMEDLGRRLCEQLQDIFSGLQLLMEEGMGGVRGVALLRQGYEKLSALASVLIGGPTKERPVLVAEPSRRLASGYCGPVLLVDDSPINLRLLQHMLRKLGFKAIDQATSGEEGFALWKERRHPLVLTDIQMPGIDGMEVCRRIRGAQGEVPPVVVAVSASLVPETKAERAASGFDSEIPKPVNLELLVGTLALFGR